MTSLPPQPDYRAFSFKKSKRFRKARHQGQLLLVRSIMALANRLSIPNLQKVGRMLGWAGFWLLPSQRRISRYQLALAFPNHSALERERIARACFQNMGMSACEAMVIPRILQSGGDWVRAEGAEHLRAAHALGKGVVMITAHSANWELISVLMARLRIPGQAVVRTHPNNGLNALLLSHRRNEFLTPLERGSPSAPRQLLRCIKGGEVLIVAIDQDVAAQGIFVDFFNIPANTPRVAASLALKLGVPVVTAFDSRQADGSHLFHIQPIDWHLDPSPAAEVTLTEIFSRAIEEHIRRYPAQWCWNHRRWKRRPGERADPIAHKAPGSL